MQLLGEAMIMVQNMAIFILVAFFGARWARRCAAADRAQQEAQAALRGLQHAVEQLVVPQALAPDPYRTMPPVLVIDDDAMRALMQEWAEYFQSEKTYKDHRTSQQRLQALVARTEAVVERASRAN